MLSDGPNMTEELNALRTVHGLPKMAEEVHLTVQYAPLLPPGACEETGVESIASVLGVSICSTPGGFEASTTEESHDPIGKKPLCRIAIPQDAIKIPVQGIRVFDRRPQGKGRIVAIGFQGDGVLGDLRRTLHQVNPVMMAWLRDQHALVSDGPFEDPGSSDTSFTLLPTSTWAHLTVGTTFASALKGPSEEEAEFQLLSGIANTFLERVVGSAVTCASITLLSAVTDTPQTLWEASVPPGVGSCVPQSS